MTIELSALQRISCVVPDAEAAARYLESLLGAEPLKAADVIDPPDDSVSTALVGLGDVVLEFIAPRATDGVWADRLAEFGPSVLSLAYFTPDAAAAAASLVEAGVALRPGGRTVLNTTGTVGFDIELATGDVNAPAPPVRGGVCSPLMQVEVTHDDIGVAEAWLRDWFDSARVELEFASALEVITQGRMRIEHVNLGNAMVQYIQPRNDAGPWWDQLQQRGRSIHNLTWFTNDMASVAAASAKAGTQDLRYFEFDYAPMFGAEHMLRTTTIGRIVDARAILGFHVELSEPMASNLNDFLFKKT